MDFVVHVDSIDWRVARRWLPLCRHVSRNERREKGKLSFALLNAASSVADQKRLFDGLAASVCLST
jgi:hypothetical protein